MPIFSIAWARTDRNEGVYDNDPDDPGGETFRGISRRHNPTWSGWATIDALKRLPGFPESAQKDPNLTRLVQDFYRRNYWEPLELDFVPDQDLANELYDCNVIMGRGTDRGTTDPSDDKGGVVVHIQNYLNLVNRDQVEGQKRWDDVKVNGIFDATTKALFKKVLANPQLLAGFKKAFSCEKYWWFKEYCRRNPKQEKFFLGWLLNRV
jgi:hypothetical protein